MATPKTKHAKANKSMTPEQPQRTKEISRWSPSDWSRRSRYLAGATFLVIFGVIGTYLFGIGHGAASIDPATWAPTTAGTYFFDRSNQTGNAQADYTARENAFGRKFDGHLYYVPADVTPSALADEQWSLKTDHVPFVIISWATGNNPNNIIPLINQGSYDKDITDFADSVKSQLSPYGHVLIRPFWEFNYTGTEWNDTHYNNDPTQFVAAWKHFVGIFQQQGVTNVKWDWNPNRANTGQSQDPTPYYPGSQYVDWIGIDSYPKNQYLTLQQLVTAGNGTTFDWYDTFKSYGKPLMVGETGIKPYGGFTRAQWWSDALSELKGPLSSIRAIEYFDANQGTNWMYDATGPAGDTGAQSLAAAQAAANDCFLNVLSNSCGGQQQNPTVTINAPSPGASVSGNVNVNMSVTNSPSKVELYVDNSLVDTITSAGAYTYGWNTKGVADGSHTLLAKAYDSKGVAYPSTAVGVTVSNTSTTGVSISSPAANSTVSGTVSVNTNVTGSPTKVAFLVDGATASTLTTSPYTYSWNTKAVADGSHTLQAVATDSTGKTFPSAVVTVTVSNSVSTGGIPKFNHVVLVMEENHGYSQIIGSATGAPYINSLANGGALFTNSHGITHPSFPNYLALFSGSVQGTTDDTCPPPGSPYAGSNLGSELIAASDTFDAYAEGLPANLRSCGPSPYAGRHVPSIWFSNVPASSAHDFNSFPANLGSLPTVSLVTPGLNHDMHSFGTETAAQEISNGDSWLQTNMSAYATWAKANNSLLILQWDEDEGTTGNSIPTIFYGANVKQGQYSENINHYSLLRTLEDMYGLAPTGAAASASPIKDVWTNSPPPPNLSVSITSPAPGSTVSGTVPVNITVTGGTGSDQVQLMLNGTVLSTMSSSPFAYNWDTSSLSPGTYTLQAKATDSKGVTATSQTVSVSINSNVPQPPTNLAATNKTPTSVSLSWSDAANSGTSISHFLVYRNNVVVGMPTTTSFTDTSLTPQTQYTYSVAAVSSSGGTSGMSTAISVTTPSVVDNQPPTVPVNVKAVAPSSTQVNLSWSPSTDNVAVAGYKISRNGTQIATTKNTSFGDGTVQASTTYSYAVAAYDAAGNVSQFSIPASVTTPTGGKPPIPNHGVTMIYYPNITQKGKSYTAVAPNIAANFDNPPLAGAPKAKNGYVLHWVGRIAVPKAGAYTLYLTSSKGFANLFVRDKLVINDQSSASGERSVTMHFNKGQYNFNLTFEIKSTAGGNVRLAWSGPGVKKSLIPTADLYPHRTNAAAGNIAAFVRGLQPLSATITMDREP